MKSNYEITPEERARSIMKRLANLRQCEPAEEFKQAIAKVEAEKAKLLKTCPKLKDYFKD